MSEKQTQREVKQFTFDLKVGVGKESKQPYIYTNGKKSNDLFLVNLIKDNKKHILSVPKGVTGVSITCTSYNYEFKNDLPKKDPESRGVNTLTLFNVSDVVFTK